ncbi:MAG TPA: hypothetical protein P5554_10265 [Spirochaetota bacterium]|nr:hypothetical protein [Spirochaetota bacterium]
MSLVKEFSNLDDFIAEMKNLNIDKIAFAEINERRPMETAKDFIEVVIVREVTLKAYKDSVIYKYHQKCDNLEEIHDFLLSEGFEIKRLNRNIT